MAFQERNGARDRLCFQEGSGWVLVNTLDAQELAHLDRVVSELLVRMVWTLKQVKLLQRLG